MFGCSISFGLGSIWVRFFRAQIWCHSDIIKVWFYVGSGLLGVGSDTVTHWNLVEPVLNSGFVLIQDSVIQILICDSKVHI